MSSTVAGAMLMYFPCVSIIHFRTVKSSYCQ
jgi:hypothetical protein